MQKIVIKELLEDSFWIMPATPCFIDEGVPYITSKNIKNGEISFDNVKFISTEDYETIAKNRPIITNDILISMIGTLGEVGIVKGEYGEFYGQNVYLLRLNEKHLEHRFFVYFMNSLPVKRMLESKKNKSTQGYLKAEHIETLEIPYYTLDEQVSIANKLEKVSCIIDKRKKQIRELDELVKSQFIEMFGDPNSNPNKWEVMKFGQVTENFDSYRYPVKSADREKMQGHYPYYGATGIVDYVNDYKLDGIYLLISEDGKSLEFRNKDIAFIASGKIWVNNHAHVLQNNELSNMRYLCHYINNIDISSYVTGIDQKKLNRSNMDSIPVMLPPVELQNQFEVFVQQVEKQKFIVQKSLEEIQVLFDALMQKYFG